MAALPKRFLRLHRDPPLLSSHTYPILRHFSTSSDPSSADPAPEIDPDRQSASSSYLKDIKATLRRESSPHMRRTSSFSNHTPPPPPPPLPPPPRAASYDEIRKKLSVFRQRTAPPPPSSSAASDQPFSFQQLYKKNVNSQTDGSDVARGKLPFDAIRQSLSKMQVYTPSQNRQNGFSGKHRDPMSLARFEEVLKLKPGDAREPQLIIGGGESSPESLFGKGNREAADKDNKVSTAMKGFVKPYSHVDMGKKLASLRPEKKGKWFSLRELNRRLDKIREMDDKEMEKHSEVFREVRVTLLDMALKPESKKNMQKFDVLSYLGGSQSFMLSPPKEHLVEKYFHPDHMSSAEKLQLELQKVRDEFKMSESDCGSARVQVAQLTTKIKHLSTVLHKKDKHSRKGLQEMVQRRKKLLKYLRRTDWDSYTLVLSKLGLRDNPDLKA